MTRGVFMTVETDKAGNVCTARPDEVTVRISPVIPVTMSRDREDENHYGVRGTAFTKSQSLLKNLIEVLKTNGIEPVVTGGQLNIVREIEDDITARDDFKKKGDASDFIALVEVKGKEDVDKLVALSKRSASAEKLIAKETHGGKSRYIP
jgi:hypothetical protein